MTATYSAGFILSSSQTDFVLAVDLSQLPAAWWNDVDTPDDPNPTIQNVRFVENNTRIRVTFSEPVTGTTGFSLDSGTIQYLSGEGTSV